MHSPSENGGRNYLTQGIIKDWYGYDDNVSVYRGYVGYNPTFEGDLSDYNTTIGVKNEMGGWKTDISLTAGGNSQNYTVNNTVNRSLGTSSPTFFKPGGFKFSHIVGNIDLSKDITDQLSISIGSEARNETYTILAGDEASYFQEGANSFPGINKIVAGSNSRFNIGAYADLSFDINPDFLISGAFRTERYSDFGNGQQRRLERL